jgi:hypothetical protein
MKDEKFTLAHAINHSSSIQLQGVKLGADEVTITLSREGAKKVVPLVLLETEWYEVQHGTSNGERKISDYDFHCPNTGMIFATYYKGSSSRGCLTINHNAN